MARELPYLLRPKMSNMDMSSIAESLRQQGRGRDTILAHITPQEAAMLKRRGGRGSINPMTGLPEFEDGDFGMAPADVAAQSPDLYPGGQLPQTGQETVFAPGGATYYQDAGAPVDTGGAGAAQPAGRQLGGGRSDVFSIHLAVEEAIVNAIVHGNKLDPRKTVHVVCHVDAEVMRIQITDEGEGFDPAQVPDCTADDRLAKYFPDQGFERGELALLELDALGVVVDHRDAVGDLGDGIQDHLLVVVDALQLLCVRGHVLGPDRRPVDDPKCIVDMVTNASLTVTAWEDGVLIGVARSVTDFAYCCYLSDLAVDRRFQRQGIGRELIARTQAKLGPRCKIVLLAAPTAAEYYPHIGMEKHSSAWVLPRNKEIMKKTEREAGGYRR